MRILLIQPPGNQEIPIGYKRNYSEKARSPLPPLGLLYLAGHLKKNHEVKVLDMAVSGQGIPELPSIINSFQPDLVGVTAVIGLWPAVVDIFNLVKKINPSIYTVVGGPNATQYPEETLAIRSIDFLITGIGQFPLMRLCNQLEQGQSGEGIENCYVQGKTSAGDYRTVYSKEYELDEFELPDREAVPFSLYRIGFCPDNPTTTMVTSMGCPFRCAFCDCHNQALQMRTAEKVVDEIAAVEKMGIKSILFQDELFTLKAERVKQICESLIKRKIKIHWSVKSRVDCLQIWMPGLMKEAGCFNIHFGIESGNDATLTRMKKGYNTDSVRRAVGMVKSAGLSCTGNFMLAYPGENETDIRNTIAFAKGLSLDLAQFSITLDLPKTELFDEALRSGRRRGNPWSEFIKHPQRIDLVEMFSSELFTPEELFAFLDEAHQCTKTLYNTRESK
jgi:radical SAM superfamily enzyme YgiQ (UPF0313 family)